MVVTPLVQKGVDVRLPNGAFTTDVPENPPVVLSIQKAASEPKGFKLYINHDRATLENLQNGLEEAFLTVSEKKLYIRMDQDLQYGVLAESTGYHQERGGRGRRHHHGEEDRKGRLSEAPSPAHR